ncbi:MAG: reverse transcriptase domain-containing protein, partial [bacterium]
QTGELRENSKSDMLDKTKKVELFRICLDFRELNNCLVFPKQVQFVNLELLLHKLKNKVCVSMDISSAFFIIPIRKEDRYKTAFWVNDLSYEFNGLVMGLKSSPYHLKMFMNIVFSAEQYEKLKKQLSQAERDLLPPSFDDLVISYFD